MRVRDTFLIFLGGALGTALRLGISQFQIAGAAWPWPTFAINISGAFILGFVLELIACADARSGSETRARRDFRLFFGTGIMGGYTTYGTFIAESDSLLQSSWWVGVAYMAASSVLGLCASGAGLWVARRVAHRVVQTRADGAATGTSTDTSTGLSE